MPPLLTFARLLSLAVGIACLLGLVLIQPDEERQFRNRLVDWWVRVTQTGESWVDALVLFTQALAAKVLAGIGELFGTKWISMHLAHGSLMLSGCMVTLFYVISRLLGPQTERLLLPVSLYPKPAFVSLPPTVLEVAFDSSLWNLESMASTLIGVSAITLWVALSFVLDCVAIAVNRLILNHAARTRAGICLLPLMTFVPLLALLVLRVLPTAQVSPLHPYVQAFMIAALGSAFAINGLIAFALVATVVGLALNAVVWSALHRILETMHERGPSRQQVFAIGMVLVGLALAPSPIGYLADVFKLPAPTTASGAQPPSPTRQ